ncbi:MAG: Uncharacterised protein [Methanobacteriota archaeon]|nr:MAG: Uncharacterised protein [Euryarchaeota archaeon]
MMILFAVKCEQENTVFRIWVDMMSASVIVCKGCCCGKIEKGHNEVPVDALKSAWEKSGLEEHVKLTISGCLGPCSMHNVSLLKTKNGNIWLGELNSYEHYDALVEWGSNVAEYGIDAELPEILVPLQFERAEDAY